MFRWSFTSFVHFWPHPAFNSGYAYAMRPHWAADSPANCDVSAPFNSTVDAVKMSMVSFWKTQ